MSLTWHRVGQRVRLFGRSEVALGPSVKRSHTCQDLAIVNLKRWFRQSEAGRRDTPSKGRIIMTQQE